MNPQLFNRLVKSVKQAVEINNGKVKPSRIFVSEGDSIHQIFLVRLSKRGTITIPAALRKQLGIVPGSRVVMECHADGFIIRHPRPGEIPGDKAVKRPSDVDEPETCILCAKYGREPNKETKKTKKLHPKK